MSESTTMFCRFHGPIEKANAIQLSTSRGAKWQCPRCKSFLAKKPKKAVEVPPEIPVISQPQVSQPQVPPQPPEVSQPEPQPPEVSQPEPQPVIPEVSPQPVPTLPLDERLRLIWKEVAENTARSTILAERMDVVETSLSDYNQVLSTQNEAMKLLDLKIESVSSQLCEVQPKEKKKPKTILYVTEEEARRLREKGKTVKKVTLVP